jgi:hypothetical protein
VHSDQPVGGRGTTQTGHSRMHYEDIALIVDSIITLARVLV